MRLFSTPIVVASILAGARAAADVPAELPQLVLDSGKRPAPAPAPDALRFAVHGEYQLRYQVEKSFTLDPSATQINARPGITADSLGQNQFLTHWLRATPTLLVRDNLQLVAQVDLLTGLVAGDLAHDTHADLTPRDEYNGFGNIQLRYLYAQLDLPFGLVRIGQQPNHWGMGILANDGDHPTLFGDYRYGSLSERILFATKPGGPRSDVVVALAGDLVYRDQFARLSRGKQAFQGVLAAYFERGYNRIGVFGMLRHQANARTSGSELTSYDDTIDALSADVSGRYATQVPGHDAFLFMEGEAAFIGGSTSMIRTPQQTADGDRVSIRSYGGAATVGVVHRAVTAPAATAKGLPFGDLVAQLEVGYASGDADPYDGTERRFTFDPNHRVGLLLFDELMRFQTARAATAAADPLLTNAARPTPGVDLLSSNGGVFGAEYVNPTFIYRPRNTVDLKAGMVVAQATSEIVDPYRTATSGSYVSYRGGDRRKKDLGLEFDAGFEARFPLDYDLQANFGMQGGVLLPGSAFEDADGNRLPAQWIVITRAGLEF